MMIEESDIRTETSGTDLVSDWNKEMERKVTQQERRQKSCSMNSEPGPSIFCVFNQKDHTSSPSIKTLQDGAKRRNGTEIPIICGDTEGILYKEKFAKKKKCILSKGQWFTVHEFEKKGGREKTKNWKMSIRHRDFHQFTLKKLITDGFLPNLSFSHRKVQEGESHVSSTGLSSQDPDSSSELGASIRNSQDHQTGERTEDEFQALSLPVICGSISGVLYKQRFASGTHGKSIRTEERWLTPQEFVKEDLTLMDGHWEKDIECYGKTLSYLLKKKILCVHPLLCNCCICSPEEHMEWDQDNDDVCSVCNFGGNLVCCEECPQAFHFSCHIPTVKDKMLGGTWICTFCVWRTNKCLWKARHMTQTEALSSPVSQYNLQCEYLLLYVYKEDVQKMFTDDPCTMVPSYTNVISQPMWLNKVKTKLMNNGYNTVGELVSDVRLIFQNCCTFNRDNEFGKVGSRLSEVFEREFQTVFNIE